MAHTGGSRRPAHEAPAGTAGTESRALPRGARRAITLAEVLVVVVLTGVLLAVALPRLADSGVWGSEGEAAAKQVAGTMRLARQMAVDHGTDNPSGYRFEAGSTSYRTQNIGTGAYGPRLYLPDGWTFEPGNYSVCFDVYGGVPAWVGSDTPEFAIQGRQARWAIRFDPSTGYTWYEPD